MKTSFPIIGMHCASCASTIERKLTHTPGVHTAAVNYGSEEASVEYDRAVTNPSLIAHAVTDIGYQAIMENSGDTTREQIKEEAESEESKITIEEKPAETKKEEKTEETKEKKPKKSKKKE